MFGNIVSIMRFNETLLGKLEKRMKNFDPETTLIGDIFITLVPFLSIYTDYCCNYGEGMSLVNKVRSENPEFAQAMIQSAIDSNGMDLQDFCITPVQRVPRYRLLLEMLIKNTPQEHPDYLNLESAIQLVSDKASEINKKMNLVENQKKMMELHRRFTSPPLTGTSFNGSEDLVQPWRFLAAEFKTKLVILSSGEIEEQDVTLYLFNDVFVLATQEEDNKLSVVTGQPLWNCYLKKLEASWTLAQRDIPPFQIVNPSGVWNLVLDACFKAKFKSDFESMRDAVLAHSADKRSKRALIKLFPNAETQEWMAVEPAPTYASNRVSTQILAAETTEYTKMALEELLSENREIFEARSVTPAKTPKKSRLGKLMDSFTPLKWSSKKAQASNSSLISTPAGSSNSSSNSISGGSLTGSFTPAKLAFGSPSTSARPFHSHSDPSIYGSSGSSYEQLTSASSTATPNHRHSKSLRQSTDLSFTSIPSSPMGTPSNGVIGFSSSSSISGVGGDKENFHSSDATNQADVIRSTIAKLSQQSKATQTVGTPIIGASSTTTSSSKHKKSHSHQPTLPSIDSPLATVVASPMEAKRRRHKRESSRVPCSPVSTN
jgi:hypothetical protein